MYFKKLPKCFFLTEFDKTTFIKNLNIESYESKLEDFFNSINVFSIQSSFLLKTYKRSRLLFNLSSNQFIFSYKVILLCSAFIINVLFLVFWNQETLSFENERGDATVWIYIFSISNCVFAFFCLIAWFYLKVLVNYKINKEEYIIEKQISNKKLKFKLKFFYLILYKSILMENNFQTFFFHFLFPILGLLISPVFFTLLLLPIIYISDLLYGIIKSFVENLQKLFFTFIIIIIFINLFSYYLGQNFRNQFKGEATDGSIFCDTYFRCFLNVINAGLRPGGGIGDQLSLERSLSSNRFWDRFFFDLLFFISINLILLGIFFGIIVDSFANYRDQISKRHKDTRDTCLTCELSRAQLERKRIDFNQHQKKDHYIFKYYYYLEYLRWKPLVYYDGIDIYISEAMESINKSRWIPHQRTMSLEEEKH